MENNHTGVASNRLQNLVVLFKMAETFVPSVLIFSVCIYVFMCWIFFGTLQTVVLYALYSPKKRNKIEHPA